MSIANLIFKEILFRRTNFLLSVLAVAAASGSILFAVMMLKSYDRATEIIIGAKEAEVRKFMDELEDSSRIITKNMGFNVLIMPRDQDLSDFFSDGYATKLMPESYSQKLAESKIITIRHLLPSLYQKVKWPEKERTIILMGVKGEVPSIHMEPQKPIMDAVKPGTAILGSELHRSLGLQAGDSIRLFDRNFSVAKCFEERGNKDDITVWINLAEAQSILGKEGKINCILALECNCAMGDIAKVRQEIAGILPDTQVIEFKSNALARAEIRRKAAQTAKASLESEKANRAKLRTERENAAAAMVAVILSCSILTVIFLSLINVKERRIEIGIFRALGFRSGQIYSTILFRAFAIGVAGSVAGCLIAIIAVMSSGKATAGTEVNILRDAHVLLLMSATILCSSFLTVAATVFPARYAAGQDPAEILREE